MSGSPANPRGAALVTGGSKRIGRAIVEALSREGHAVAIHANRSGAEAEALAAELAASGCRAIALTAPLEDAAAVAGLVPSAEAALGPLTLVVNNASLFEDDRIAGFEPERFDAHMAVNLRAPLIIAREFARAVRDGGARPDPSIVNIVDQRVWKLTPQHLSYTLSKVGLEAATRSLAQALAPAIRVNAVGPGPTLPSTVDGPERFLQEAAGTLLARAVAPEDIAQAVLFLARARNVTGQMIAVDAGQHLAWRTPDIVGE
jgi:NAD(P)-dependent dehydrogenase (short-subunit alcohol dehydrogenase family)